MATTQNPDELVVISNPKVEGTARRTRKQLERLKDKGWREVKGADANAPVADPSAKDEG